LTVTANGATVYTRTKQGFATDLAVTASNYTTQYSTAYNNSTDKHFLTILTDNADTEATAYGECTINHNADGTASVTLAWEANCTFADSIKMATGSATVSLPTIPRATTPTVGTLTMGTAGTITLNPAASSFTHTLRYAVGSASGTIITKTSNTSVSWTPPLSLANQVPNATKAVGTLYCDTYSGNTLVGTKSVSMTLNVPASVVPDATYTLTDSNSAIAVKFSAFIQSKSKVQVAINATGAYGSTISSVTTTINGTTYTGTSFTTEALEKSGSQSISITVKDSRARTKTVTGTFTVLAYKPPQITELSVFRCNSSGVASHTGTYVSVKVKVAITALNDKNDSTIKAQQKRKTATSYADMKTWTGSYVLTGTYVTGGSLSNQYAYDIRLMAKDYFETIFAYADIATADTILSIRNNGLGLAIGKISEQNLFEVGWPSEFHEAVTFDESLSFAKLKWLCDLIYPIGSIRMTTSTTGATSFLGGTWELWGSGRVPIGVDTNDNDFKTVEKTGGEKTVALAAANLPSHSHTLSSGTVTIANAAAHTHPASTGAYKVGSGNGSNYKYFTNEGSTNPQETGDGGEHKHTATLSGSTGTVGSGTAHNNVPPYITCYFYKRTA
jgi:microcystin-dependent protein